MLSFCLLFAPIVSGVGVKGMEVNLATDHHPETSTKHLQSLFAVTYIALSLKRLVAK